jgi:hypothetical protein
VTQFTFEKRVLTRRQEKENWVTRIARLRKRSVKIPTLYRARDRVMTTLFGDLLSC